jgi:hypothetical protein
VTLSQPGECVETRAWRHADGDGLRVATKGPV